VSEIIEDSNGWADDFRAPPGKCGSEISRRIYLHSLLSQGISLRQIKKMGFSKEMAADMNEQLIREEYDPRVGDMVKPSENWLGRNPEFENPDVIGVVTSLLDRDRVIVCWMDACKACEEYIEDIEVVSE